MAKKKATLKQVGKIEGMPMGTHKPMMASKKMGPS